MSRVPRRLNMRPSSLPATGSGVDTLSQLLAWPANDGGGNAWTKATAVDSFRT